MAEKYHFMFHKTDKTLRGYAKLLAQSRYTPGDVQELFGGDYKKLFPAGYKPPEYDGEIHIIYYGEAIPYPKYNATTGTMENMSEYERYIIGDRPLTEGEYIEGEEIKKKENPSGYHTWDAAAEDYILTETKENEWLEVERDKARAKRETEFEALDLYDKSVLRGDVAETTEQKTTRDAYRQAWLDLPENYTNASVDIETLYPTMPEFIAYFK